MSSTLFKKNKDTRREGPWGIDRDTTHIIINNTVRDFVLETAVSSQLQAHSHGQIAASAQAEARDGRGRLPVARHPLKSAVVTPCYAVGVCTEKWHLFM